MKIEDINYTLPTAETASENFDKEKWLRQNPIDYFKLVYVLLNSIDGVVNIQSDIILKYAFLPIYKLTRLYIPEVLYKFYSLTDNKDLNDKKLLTLKNKKIYLSDIKEFNDPFDGKAFFYNPKELSTIKRLSHCGGRIIDDFTKFHRCTALTENDTSCMPMWAHYTNNHKGFCVAYDMNDSHNINLFSCVFPMQYTDVRLDITSYMKKYAENTIASMEVLMAKGERRIELNDMSIVYVAELLNYIKQTTWKYEKEFRCSVSANDKGVPYVDAYPKAIYIGMNCQEEYRKKLIEIAKFLKVPVYQMCFNEQSENYILETSLLEF